MRAFFAFALLAASSSLACSSVEGPAAPTDPGPAQPIVEVVSEQEILTPLPLRVRLPASYGASYVLALVRTYGSLDWEITELARNGQTWSGEVSCRQVSTVTGDTKYFFLALDTQGEVVASSGSPDWPHVATVVTALPEGPQALAGEPPPKRCHDVATCPPDFPGCPAYTFLRPACSAHEQCASGRCEWDGYCEAVARYGTWQGEGVGATEDELLARAIQRAQSRFKTAQLD
jgi:hypothetical protein